MGRMLPTFIAVATSVLIAGLASAGEQPCDFLDQGEPSRGGQPTGARIICGTARTNQFGDVDWAVFARDRGEPGADDEFTIRLRNSAGIIVYTTEADSDHTLGGAGSGGGNIQLHKPNPSTTGEFGGSCPALAGPPPAGS